MLGKSLIKFLKYIFLIATNLLSLNQLVQGKPDYEWLTYYELSHYLETPRYDETINFCKKLDSGSNQIKYTSFGISPQGRELPLLIYDKLSNFSPTTSNRDKRAVILIQACIHAGECDGKDAGLMLFRDIVVQKKHFDIPGNAIILFIPILNVDGHERFGPYNRINQNGPKEMGWRTNAQNFNLNRDYLKADTPEIQAWLKLFNEWLPDFFIDCHVTDGADYQYTITYGMELFGNMSENLTHWQKEIFLKQLNDSMTNAGFPMAPYIVFRNWHDPRSGLVSWVAPPFLSEGYTAIQNRPGLLLETHMLKDYKTRVTATYEALRYSIKIINDNITALKQYVTEADNYCMSKEFRKKGYTLTFRAADDSTIINFLGVEYGSEKSDISGGTWFKYSNKPVNFKIPYFNKQVPETSIILPDAYIIPPEWEDVINRMKLHGIKINMLDSEIELKVKSYILKNPKWIEKPYEGRFTVSFDYDEIEEIRTYPKGSAIINMEQRASQVVAHILEPKAPDSYVHWGFFNAIFEQKEYVESYIMEKLAREMLESDEKLKKEFEVKKTDTTFANNPHTILNWFYVKSIYWDKKHLVYPVGRIEDINSINNFKF